MFIKISKLTIKNHLQASVRQNKSLLDEYLGDSIHNHPKYWRENCLYQDFFFISHRIQLKLIPIVSYYLSDIMSKFDHNLSTNKEIYTQIRWRESVFSGIYDNNKHMSGYSIHRQQLEIHEYSYIYVTSRVFNAVCIAEN